MAAPTEPVGGFVLYGEIVEHVEAPYLSGSTLGIRIVPRYEFQVPAQTPDGSYEIYPMGLAPDCRPVPARTRSDLPQPLTVGSIVGVVGAVPDRTPIPGDIDVNREGVLFTVSPRCDLAELARREHDYDAFEVACGDYRFEANKDIALLDEASQAERLAILERLASYRGLVAYLGLLAKHVPDPAAGRRLLERRYAEMATLSCLAAEQELERFDWERRLRWGEYCTQRDPYDPQAPSAWDLYEAIAYNRVAVVADFLEQGGDPNEPLRGTPMGWVYPLKVAVFAHSEPIALALLRAGADFERSGLESHSVSSTGMARVWEFLLTQRPDRLHRALETIGSACFYAYYDVVDVLTRHALESRVTLERETVPNCVMTSPDTVRLLLERGVPVTRSALATAARFASVGIVRLLLDHGADPSERYPGSGPDDDAAGLAAIDFAWGEYEFKDEAARERVHYILHELAPGPPLRNGERVDGLAKSALAELETYAEPAERLAFAARIGLYDAVEELIADGDAFAPAVLRDAARVALEGRHPDVVRLLLVSGAPAGGGTLHTAAQTGPAGIVKHLIALGAGINERVDGATPLESWLASAARHYEVLQALVMAGADVCDVVARHEPDAWSRDTVVRAASECAP